MARTLAPAMTAVLLTAMLGSTVQGAQLIEGPPPPEATLAVIMATLQDRAAPAAALAAALTARVAGEVNGAVMVAAATIATTIATLNDLLSYEWSFPHATVLLQVLIVQAVFLRSETEAIAIGMVNALVSLATGMLGQATLYLDVSRAVAELVSGAGDMAALLASGAMAAFAVALSGALNGLAQGIAAANAAINFGSSAAAHALANAAAVLAALSNLAVNTALATVWRGVAALDGALAALTGEAVSLASLGDGATIVLAAFAALMTVLIVSLMETQMALVAYINHVLEG